MPLLNGSRNLLNSQAKELPGDEAIDRFGFGSYEEQARAFTEVAGNSREGQRSRSLTFARGAGPFSTCANPHCSSGWLHLWRSRSAPIFEGGWSCGSACTAARVQLAVRREMEGRRDSVGHRHRVPLGLVMLEQGWITPEQLRHALEAQRATGAGKIGFWLTQQPGISEQLVTRALSLQWNCPVLQMDSYDPEAMAPVLPRLFVEAFGALPLRLASGRILYMGFEDRLDPVVTLATERMMGLRVEAGLVQSSLFQTAQERMLRTEFPSMQLMETASESPIVRVLARAIERTKPVESRLVRIHDCLWLRLWTQPQTGALPSTGGVEDVICSLIAA